MGAGSAETPLLSSHLFVFFLISQFFSFSKGTHSSHMKRARSAAVTAVSTASSIAPPKATKVRVEEPKKKALAVKTTATNSCGIDASLRLADGVSCWLVKSEPHVFSIEDFREEYITQWDGVRNYEARNVIKSMKKDDVLLVYHSNAKPPGVVGLATVSEEWYPDPTALDKKSEYFDANSTQANNRWAAMKAKFHSRLPRLVTLDEIRANGKLIDMALVKRGRLSVQPVTPNEYKVVLGLAFDGSTPVESKSIFPSKKKEQ